jgi:hypothetical protein
MKEDADIKEFLNTLDKLRGRVVNILIKPDFLKRVIDYMDNIGLVKKEVETALEFYSGIPVYETEYIDHDYEFLKYHLDINKKGNKVNVAEVEDI